MATRDLHDQKVLRALEGIEKQFKEFNKNFMNVEDANKTYKVIIHNPDGFTFEEVEIFTNSDGTVTPLIPSKNINYYVRYTDMSGIIRSTVTAGSKLLENEILRKIANDILFCCEPENMIDE